MASKTCRVDDDVYAALCSLMRKPGQNFSTVVRDLLRNHKPEVKELSAKNGIKMFFHCKRCLQDRPENISPASWARLSVGFTKEGLQVWCWRHGINVAHIHFEGQCHPANLGALPPDPDNKMDV